MLRADAGATASHGPVAARRTVEPHPAMAIALRVHAPPLHTFARTKIQRPCTRTGALLPRPGLQQRLTQAIQQRSLVLLCATADYGKTSAMVQPMGHCEGVDRQLQGGEIGTAHVSSGSVAALHLPFRGVRFNGRVRGAISTPLNRSPH